MFLFRWIPLLTLLPGCWTTVETLTGRMCTYCPVGTTIVINCIGG